MFHILVVDDDKNTRLFLRAVLEGAGYTVTSAENGKEALGVFEREHIDLVVLDVMMPELDGYEFTRTLREVDNNLPILMVSAKQMPADKHKAFLAGTDDYMTKPVDDEEMFFRIKALLRLLSERVDPDSFDIKEILSILDELRGESVVAYKNGDIVKVHVHTFTPGEILTRMQAFGEFLTVKIENMSLGHSEGEKAEKSEKPKMAKKKFAVVAVAFGLCFPGIGDALKKSGGRLTPAAIVRLLKTVKKPKVMDLALVAVRPEYQNSGVNAGLVNGIVDMLCSCLVEKCETNLNLETNTAVMAQWKYCNSRHHKRRRAYVKSI